MKINITLDTSSVTRLAARIGKSRIIAGAAVLALAGASTYAYAISNTPTHVFVAGDAISASDVNDNFSELFVAANAVESDISSLQSSITSLENAPDVNSCTWQYNFISGSTGNTFCDTGRFAINGTCAGFGGAIINSRPINNLDGNPSTRDPVTNTTGWLCTAASGTSSIDARVLCCPQ